MNQSIKRHVIQGFFPVPSATLTCQADGLLRGASGVSGALLGEPKMAKVLRYRGHYQDVHGT